MHQTHRQIPLPSDARSLCVVCEGASVRFERSALPTWISGFTTAVFILIAVSTPMLFSWLYFGSLIPAGSAYVVLMGIAYGLFIVAVGAYFFDHHFLRESTVERGDDDSIVVIFTWAGGFRRRRSLTRPIELHVILDAEPGIGSYAVQADFYLQEKPMLKRNRWRARFGRSIELFPTDFVLRRGRPSWRYDALVSSEERVVEELIPLAECVSTALQVPVKFMRTGGNVIRQFDSVPA